MSNIYTFQFLKDLEIKRKAMIMIEGPPWCDPLCGLGQGIKD